MIEFDFFLLFLFLVLGAKGGGQTPFDDFNIMCLLLLEFHVLFNESSFLRSEFESRSKLYFIVILLPKYSILYRMWTYIFL